MKCKVVASYNDVKGKTEGSIMISVIPNYYILTPIAAGKVSSICKLYEYEIFDDILKNRLETHINKSLNKNDFMRRNQMKHDEKIERRIDKLKLELGNSRSERSRALNIAITHYETAVLFTKSISSINSNEDYDNIEKAVRVNRAAAIASTEIQTCDLWLMVAEEKIQLGGTK